MYKYIMKILKREGISGATVYKGICGYGVRGIAEFDIFRLSVNLPVIIECVDIEENINKVLPKLYEIIKDNGLIEQFDGYFKKRKVELGLAKPEEIEAKEEVEEKAEELGEEKTEVEEEKGKESEEIVTEETKPEESLEIPPEIPEERLKGE